MPRKPLLSLALAALALAACAQGEPERLSASLSPPESCVEARHIATYAMLSDRTVAVGDARGYTIAEMDVPAAGFLGLRFGHPRRAETFAIVTPDGLLCNRAPIAARISYGGREAPIERVRFVRPAPLGFGSLGVPSGTHGKGVPIFARADRPATEVR